MIAIERRIIAGIATPEGARAPAGGRRRETTG
jgi:hypothetical protein